MANDKKLRKLADFLEKNPGKYDQGSWIRGVAGSSEGERIKTILADKNVCGTACCAAGWTVSQNRPEAKRLLKSEAVKAELDLDWHKSNGYAYPDETWSVLAREILGLEEETASWLFDSIRCEEAMPGMLRMLADGHDVDDLDAFEDVVMKYGDYLKV